MRKIALALAVPCALFAVDPFFSIAHANNVSQGGYLGLKAGFSQNKHSCAPAAMACDRSGGGYGAVAGYDFNSRLGVEIGYTQLADSNAEYPNRNLTGELRVMDVTAKYSRSLFGNSRIFAKAGATYWQGNIKGWGVEVDGSGVTPTLAAGVALPLTNRLASRLEYQYFGNVGDGEIGRTQPHFLSFGLIWHFSSRTNSSSHTKSLPELHPALSRPFLPEVLAEADPAPATDNPVSQTAPTDAETETNDLSSAPESEPQFAAVEAPLSNVDVVDDLAENVEEAEPSTPIVIDDHNSPPLFAQGSSVLKINYPLEKIAVDLLRSPHLFVHVVVHTDDQGGHARNQELSKARADKLADYLIWQGVNPDRVSVEGRGESHPLVDEQTEIARARNRRAEFFISETRLRP